MVVEYSAKDKARIKANPLMRVACTHIREVTVAKYREYQRAEKSLALATDKNRKELTNEFEKVKTIYLEARAKFDLYKELFPDIVQ